MAPPSLGRAALYRLVTSLWAVALQRGSPRLFPRRVLQPWSGGEALIVAPHPDDECLGAGGAALLHRAQGDGVTVVMVTDGRRSRAVPGPPEARAAMRQQEAEAACAHLDATLVWLGLPESAWHADEARARLAPLIENAPIVYLPSVVDFHPEHLAVARAVAPLLHPQQAVRVYELGVPLTPTLTTLVADTQPVAHQLEKALAAHASQRRAWEPLARRRAYRAALYGNPDGEPFWALCGEAYDRMTAEGPWTWHTAPFRGLRPRPFSDGLAYLRGQPARRALWRAHG